MARAKRIHTCERCGEEISTETAQKMGGKYWCFECPDKARDRTWAEMQDMLRSGRP